uniref:High mobility group B protein 7 n=1 Tax=Noccaea caerulescens TaxID=107243 RepID=A0A1J3F506_NOCCA
MKPATPLRDKCGRALVRCEGCNKSVAVALRSMHNCSLDAKIRVNLEAQAVETQTEATPYCFRHFSGRNQHLMNLSDPLLLSPFS